MSGRERNRNRTRSLDSDHDSRASQTEGSSAEGLEEDKEVASEAVLFFINGMRRGTVHLCSSIAEILRENQRLHRTVEVQRVRIDELMCLLSTAPAAPVGPSDSNRSQTSTTSLPDTSPSSPFPCLPSISLASFPYLPSPPASVSPSVSSLYSSGRGSLSSSATPPCLPPLVPLHTLTPHRRQTPALPCVEEYEREDPGEDESRGEEDRRGDERRKKRGGERRQEEKSLILPCVKEALGSQPLPIMPHSPQRDSTARERVRRREKCNLSSEQGGQTSDQKHTLKKIEKVLRRSASCGPIRGEMERKEEEEERRRCLAPDCPGSSSTVPAAAGWLDPREITTRKKHRLCLNDRVVLERRRKGEERRRGAVRFIGPLENTDATNIYIGVELDTANPLQFAYRPNRSTDDEMAIALRTAHCPIPSGQEEYLCGENEGSLHGNRYFRCEPNHGTFTTITGIRKLSRSSHSSKSRSSNPPEEGDSSDTGPGSSAVARSSRGVGRSYGKGLRRTRNQMDIRAQVHSEPGGPRDTTTVENPGPD